MKLYFTTGKDVAQKILHDGIAACREQLELWEGCVQVADEMDCIPEEDEELVEVDLNVSREALEPHWHLVCDAAANHFAIPVELLDGGRKRLVQDAEIVAMIQRDLDFIMRPGASTLRQSLHEQLAAGHDIGRHCRAALETGKGDK